MKGKREDARQILQFRNWMDARVRRTNPDWWTANNSTAENHRLREAAELGRYLPLKEGAAVQEAADKMAGTNAIQRDAFRIGLGRKAHDEVSGLGDNHDVSKIFLKGGANQEEEGVRGILGSSLLPGDGTKFINQMVRERTARETYGLDKKSNTASLIAGDKRRGALMEAAMSLARGVGHMNPLEFLPAISRFALSKANAARDRELGQMLAVSTENPAAMLRLLREVASTSAQHARGLQPLIDQVTDMAARTAIPGMAGDFSQNKNQRPLGIASDVPR